MLSLERLTNVLLKTRRTTDILAGKWNSFVYIHIIIDLEGKNVIVNSQTCRMNVVA